MMRFGHWLQSGNSLSFAPIPIHIPFPISKGLLLHVPNGLIPLRTVHHKNLIFSSKIIHLQGMGHCLAIVTNLIQNFWVLLSNQLQSHTIHHTCHLQNFISNQPSKAEIQTDQCFLGHPVQPMIMPQTSCAYNFFNFNFLY